jgi:diaminohydroxyphosphoribosylaminopyrimidine deaminase/5-amino-6-(5-phosphoribosylamino)uracil reductase
MRKALSLAEQGFPKTRPNPMVGAVLVSKDQEIIGEGFHRAYGEPHAEVVCLNDAQLKGASADVIASSTLYVTLEPCAHSGKTPPCIDTIISHNIKKIVVSTLDPNPLVNGEGIAALQRAGIEVITGVLEKESQLLNKRFFCFHQKKRPYVILKWAQTIDGFIAQEDGTSKWISGESARGLVHKWRDEEMAIMIGTMTAILDNPFLTSRLVGGRNPVRIILDRELKIPTSFNVFDESAKTILFNELEDYNYGAAELVKIPFDADLLPHILDILYQRGLQSLIVEGGSKLLHSFIDLKLWDEARIVVNEKKFLKGIPAPKMTLPHEPTMSFLHDKDKLYIIS